MRMTIDEFLQGLGPITPREPATRLRFLLGRYDRGAPLADRLDWIEELGDWVLRSGGRITAGPGVPAEPQPTRRLRLLIRACEVHPEAREIVTTALGSLFAETSAVRLLTETGLPGSHGFFRELTERLVRRFLPAPRTDRELADLVARIFSSSRHVAWLTSAPRPLLTAFAELAGRGATHPEPADSSLRAAVLDAIDLLAMRVAVLGTADDVRARGPRSDVPGSPFVNLQARVRAMVEREAAPGGRLAAGSRLDSDGLLARGSATEDEARGRAEALRECRAFVREVLSNLDRSGVSVDLVYRLELINKSLLRLERMSQAIVSPSEEKAKVAADLFARLLSDAAKDRSVGSLVHANLRQLSRKIVERAGESGEHYITNSRAEWRAMIGSAAGGGLLTVGTIFAKLRVHALHPPPFFEGMFAAANYGGSFVMMQLLGFTLATKQPSMTAAALAHQLSEEEEGKEQNLAPLVDQIARISRSQLAAAFGNLLMVVFAACVVETALRFAGWEPILVPKEARGIIASLSPFSSGTIFFAALTGVLLWASSVGAGWFENWAAYQRIPEGIAASRGLRRVIGKARARRVAAWFTRNLSGFGGNLTLGFLLGMVPVLGKFFGLPLEVRHVTLSMGSLAFAGFSLVESNAGVPILAFLAALCGIAVIGLLNFGVSFALALEVALRARDVGRTGHFSLVKAVGQRMLASPRDFVFPPADAPLPVAVSAAAADGGAPSVPERGP